MAQTRTIPLRAFIWLGALALAAGVFAEPAADAGRQDRRAGCPQADIVDVRIADRVAISGIRVVVSDRSPIGGAVDVRIDDGATDRVVHVRGAVSKQLDFSPALTSDQVMVSIDPVLSARNGVCIDRVELLSGNAAVATVRPH